MPVDFDTAVERITLGFAPGTAGLDAACLTLALVYRAEIQHTLRVNAGADGRATIEHCAKYTRALVESYQATARNILAKSSTPWEGAEPLTDIQVATVRAAWAP